MDVAYVNKLLGNVKIKLESLDPSNELSELEMQQADSEDSANSDSRMGAAKARLQHLLNKLGANRSDSNYVKAYGTQ
jgi:hypothetical protein